MGEFYHNGSAYCGRVNSYPGLEIIFLDDVFGITLTSPKHATRRDVRVGSSLKDVTSAYGKSVIEDSEIRYYSESSGKALIFEISKGKVKKIASTLIYDP